MQESPIAQLIRYGYLPPGEYPSMDDARVVDAIERYRDFMQVCTRDLESLFSIPRCGCPDIAADDTGSGSWPVGCHAEYPKNHAFAVFFDLSGMPSHWKSAFEAAWDLVVKAYANIGIVFFRVADRKKANTIVTWQRGSGWIGLAIVPRGPKCGQTIWAKYDNRYGSSFSIDRLINQLAYLMAHEFGHNMGMSHTRGGIMNPSLINGTFHSDQWRKNDPAFATLKRYFGGEPVELESPTWSIPQPEQPRE
jgi:hypothetical protein